MRRLDFGSVETLASAMEEVGIETTTETLVPVVMDRCIDNDGGGPQ